MTPVPDRFQAALSLSRRPLFSILMSKKGKKKTPITVTLSRCSSPLTLSGGVRALTS